MDLPLASLERDHVLKLPQLPIYVLIELYRPITLILLGYMAQFAQILLLFCQTLIAAMCADPGLQVTILVFAIECTLYMLLRRAFSCALQLLNIVI